MNGHAPVIFFYLSAQEESEEKYLGKPVVSRSPRGRDQSRHRSQKTLHETFPAPLTP